MEVDWDEYTGSELGERVSSGRLGGIFCLVGAAFFHWQCLMDLIPPEDRERLEVRRFNVLCIFLAIGFSFLVFAKVYFKICFINVLRRQTTLLKSQK